MTSFLNWLAEDVTPNGSLRRRRSRVPSEEDDNSLMDYLRTSGHADGSRERKSTGNIRKRKFSQSFPFVWLSSIVDHRRRGALGQLRRPRVSRRQSAADRALSPVRWILAFITTCFLSFSDWKLLRHKTMAIFPLLDFLQLFGNYYYYFFFCWGFSRLDSCHLRRP